MRFSVQLSEFARALSNALAFIPAASKIQELYFRLEPWGNELMILGTDAYAAGMTVIPIQDYSGPVQYRRPIERGIPKEVAVRLERACRALGRVPATVTVGETSVEVSALGSETPIVEEMRFRPETPFGLIVDRMVAARRRAGTVPGVVCLDPVLFSRFGKVRTAGKEDRRADLLFGDGPLDPVLVKIGADFFGLIMPVDRERYASAVGEESTW